MSDEQVKEWEDKLAGWADYVTISANVLLMVQKIVDSTVTNKDARAGTDIAVRAIYKGLQEVIEIFRNEYDKVKKDKKKPDFTNEPLPPPSKLPDLPAEDGKSAISWWQMAWSSISATLDAVARKVPKISVAVGPMEAAGKQLVEDLDKYFGKPSGYSTQ